MGHERKCQLAQLFLYPASIELSKSGVPRVRHAYSIRHARLDPYYAASERRTIAGRTPMHLGEETE
jgi:hypothetical protein